MLSLKSVTFSTLIKASLCLGFNVREMKVGVEFLLNIWVFSSSPPPTSKMCMAFGKQIINWICHRYLKNAFLNIQELLFLSSAILFRALVTKLYVIISILLFLGFYFDFLKNEQPLIKKTNIKYLFY